MLTRRSALSLICATTVVPKAAFASTPVEVTWDDLIPAGVPYSEIIDEGVIDLFNDTWNPVYDDNAVKLNETLNGAYIKMPGYIVPLDVGSDGVRDFLLVPYVGACVHTPPPPANQLVMVKTKDPWPSDGLWDPVWVTGMMQTQLQDTDLGKTGYSLAAEDMEIYEW